MNQVEEPDGVVRVLLVDDHVMFASSVAAALEIEPDLVVVGTAPDLATARARVADGHVDVVLLDQRLRDALCAARVRELDALVLAAAGTSDPPARISPSSACSWPEYSAGGPAQLTRS